MAEEIDILGYLAKGGKLTAPGNAPSRYRAEVMRIMASFIDSELAGAAGFADAINEAPGVTERIAAARIVVGKLEHAKRILGLLGEFGADTARYERVHPWAARIGRDEDIGAERRGEDMRLNVFHYPFEGWLDAVVMNVLMGAATVIQLRELSDGSYQPLSAALYEILPEELAHAELGEEGLKTLAASDPAARERISASVDYWIPKVAATFGSAGSPRTETLIRLGLRRRRNEELLDEWRERINGIISENLQSWA